MKKTIKYITLIALSISFFTACEDDDFNKIAAINLAPVSISMEASDNNVIVMESAISGEEVYTLTASIAEPQAVDFAIVLEQVGGTAEADVDFSFDHSIVINAGDTSGTGEIHIYQTGDIETDETLAIRASTADKYANFTPFTFNANITDDYISDVLDLTLSWDGTAASGDVTVDSFCGIDFDLILYDGGFGYMGYVLGSADCPEEGGLGGLPDGTYYLVSDLYDNPLAGLGFTDTIPLALSWSQEAYENVGSISSAAHTLSDTSGTGGLIVVLEVANGYEYTLSPF